MAEKSHSPDTVAVLSLFLLCSIFCNINLIPCVSEEIQNSVVVLADYFVINENRPEHIPTVSARVTSPYGNNLYHNENASHGQFAFTTSEAGNYMACFWLDSHQPQSGTTTLSLDWKIGIAAKDWDSVARKEKIEAISFNFFAFPEGVELDLMRLEGVVQSVHNNVIYLREKEAEMREVSERTNARVAWFSIMSLGVSIAVSVLQLWHLKRYFQKKKLI
ncbi:hypothetical protein MANES_18G075700v8 [Manihot esculenta]|uniref:Uncharacterized protein n=1 Tax=Manihot esculenta TaxID=3983 RepID=A0ACB7FZ28_MANES|nr:hypothetical protein MANES_18G075700v8 [Manihot esculenta]